MTKTTEKKTSDQLFAEQIIGMLKEGTTPWQKPWKEDEAFDRIPYNIVSKAHYRGANIVKLFISAGVKGYSDPRWATYKQASDNNWNVRKGEHGTRISFFKWVSSKEVNDSDDTEDSGYMACKVYTVFNAQQIEGIAPLNTTPMERKWKPIELGERILEDSKAKIKYDGKNSAFYDPDSDSIHLPMRAQFETDSAFYSVACHELAHWTGADGRLNRNIKNTFGTEDYAKEELRAEIASWMIAVQTGLPFDPTEHAGYVGSWIKSIRNDFHELFRACADAQKIVDFLLEGIVINEDVEA